MTNDLWFHENMTCDLWFDKKMTGAWLVWWEYDLLPLDRWEYDLWLLVSWEYYTWPDWPLIWWEYDPWLLLQERIWSQRADSNSLLIIALIIWQVNNLSLGRLTWIVLFSGVYLTVQVYTVAAHSLIICTLQKWCSINKIHLKKQLQLSNSL